MFERARLRQRKKADWELAGKQEYCSEYRTLVHWDFAEILEIEGLLTVNDR